MTQPPQIAGKGGRTKKWCINCKWWNIDSEIEEQGAEVGWCVRYPPIFKGEIGIDESIWASDWPKTNAYQYCGEFSEQNDKDSR